ncbi:MAG TPA: helix-turn-helix domain-containing protein [Verrucomicrobiae bacterium]|jgi:AraC-like DNA-binding protein|nr:helix-turn-helix domain-containing protein [Verrucomicrobiae bacterium]
MLTIDVHKAEVWRAYAPKCLYSAAEFGRLASVSHTHLTRCSQSLFQTTPQKYFDILRLLAAPAILEEKLSVKETAKELGINHREQLSRQYTRFWGVSPKVYLLLDKGHKHTLTLRIRAQFNGWITVHKEKSATNVDDSHECG